MRMTLARLPVTLVALACLVLTTVLAASVAILGRAPDASGELQGSEDRESGPVFQGVTPQTIRAAMAHVDGPSRRGRVPREFYFSRAAYTGYYRFRDYRSWQVDFPKADRQFLIGLRRLTNLDAYEAENPVRLTDPALGRYPFLYSVEVGYMQLTDAEVQGLRRYLLAGGFLVVDDFWGSFEYANFAAEIQRVLPGYPVVDITLDHPIFNCFYNITEIVQVPNVGQGIQGGPTWESDGYHPSVKGIYDERGRLMVVVNWNTDLGDAWEWAENPYYPLKFSTYAYQMGVNYIIYAMSH